MIQGTTPTIRLTVPMDTATIVESEFTLNDYETNVRIWKLDEMRTDGHVLSIDLTEAETLALEPRVYKAQLRVKLNNGKIMASKIIPLRVSDLLSGVTI